MRCADCGLYECILRAPLGGCPKGEKAEQGVIFTAPDTGLHSLGNGPWDKGYKPTDATKAPEEGYWLRALSDEALMKELEMRKHPLFNSASDLVDAVERYMRQECLRSELAMKKDKLKALLHE